MSLYVIAPELLRFLIFAISLPISTQQQFFLSYPVFLSSELQAAQISQCGRVANTQDSSPGHQELLAMCSTLSLPEAAGQDAAGVLSQVREAVGTRPVSFEWPVHEVYWHLVVRNHIASNAVLRNMTNPWADSCFIHVKNMYVFFFLL